VLRLQAIERPNSTTDSTVKEKCLVWFKGSASWRPGFVASPSPKADHVLVEALEFVPCSLPLWRVTCKQPEDLNQSPVVPDGAVWKA
jgi:hypothetical protein